MGYQAELTDHQTVLASYASLTASAGTVLPQHDYKQIHSLGTSATNSATWSEGPPGPTSFSLGLCSTRLGADSLIRHVCCNYLLPASMVNTTLVTPLRCERRTSLLPASIAIENRLQLPSLIRANDVLWFLVSTWISPESAILNSQNRPSQLLLAAMTLNSLLPTGRAPVHFTAGSSQHARLDLPRLASPPAPPSLRHKTCASTPCKHRSPTVPNQHIQSATTFPPDTCDYNNATHPCTHNLRPQQHRQAYHNRLSTDDHGAKC
jgi:hypothetical protein